MRILLVSEVFYPIISGASVSTGRLAAGLVSRGHEVVVLTAQQGKGAVPQEILDNYQIIRLPAVPNPFRKGLYLSVFARKKVKLLFETFQPDIVHIQDPISLSIQATRLAKKRVIPVLATHHFLPDFVQAYLPKAFPVRFVATYWVEQRLRRLYKQCAALTVPTQTVLKEPFFASLHKPVYAISNGVDMNRFKPGSNHTFRKRYAIAEDMPIILCLGRIDPEKNLSILFEACARITTDFRLLMIGSGNSLAALQQEAQERGLDSKIIWISRLSSTGPALVSAYQVADIFCIPAAHETESMVTMEAMACGLPILASNSGALPELVENGSNGYLLSSEDSGAWQAALGVLLQNPDLRRQFGAVSRSRIAPRDTVHTLEEVEALYAQLLATD